jgi:hypothetical protein
MWEWTASLPRARRTRLLSGYLEGARRILKAGPPSLAAGGDDRIEAVARWYGELRLDCPFLEGGACSAYARRPLACREFFAYCHTSPAFARVLPPGAGLAAVAEPVRLPVSPAAALSRLAEEFEPNWPKAIVLPLALAWAADAATRPLPRRWPADTLAKRLADILQSQAAGPEQVSRVA